MATKQKSNPIEGEPVLRTALKSAPKKPKSFRRRNVTSPSARRRTRPVKRKKSVDVPRALESKKDSSRVEAESTAALVLTVILLAIILIVGGFVYLSSGLA
jgi:hypothetical protein